jgi:5'-methylthioadenosine phosphorylase
MTDQPILAVIGGSGLYAFPDLKDAQQLDLDTPFGKPSAPVVIGTLEGRTVAFLARHGIGHHLSPSEVPYRANIYALKSIGVERVVSVSACGSLRDDYAPGHIVIPDQVFDFTHGRSRSFFGEGLVAHIGAANPYCPILSHQLFSAVNESGGVTHFGGTYITIEGPRFSTRGESHLYRSWGMSIIGMTCSPEVFLAREAEMCYATMAHVTDYDVWHTSEEPVSVEMVIRTLLKNTELAQNAIKRLIHLIVPERTRERPCECPHALESAVITHPDSIPPATRQKLDLLVGKYLP